ncbi:AAA family ATPase [Cyanobacteria bacterium FACHB-63]|nr:AAA family ATPase [Cyanobacteria bacterium FACHB-63]
MEFKTHDLGSVAGGSSSKWGIWWSKNDQEWKWNKTFQCSDPNDAFSRIRSGLVSLINAAASDQFDQLEQIGSSQLGPNRNGLRAKPLYLYFPDQFLPISNPYHLTHFLTFFGQQPVGGLHTKNRQLLKFLRSQPEFNGMDTLQMMAFLYSAIPPGDRAAKSPSESENPERAQLPEEIVQLATLTEETRNLILYGPPGTGKTYAVNKFASFFLGEQLTTPLAPEQQRREILQPLTWHDAIALAMYLERPKKYFKVPDLVNNPLIQEYLTLTKTQKLSNQIWAMLQIHTHPDVETVKYKNRQPPYLFEKNQQSEWSLTEEGEGYIEVNLADALDDLQQPHARKPLISDYLRFVTFHQSFAYEEFVEGLKPVVVEGKIQYQVVDGIFKGICRQAQIDPDHRYLIIIDEINRANIAKVFGELITLIEDDKRLGEDSEIAVRLPYSQEEFGVPENLYILGTMNTADRSISLLDIALRRRFTFVELLPDPSLLATIEGVDLSVLLTRINQCITALLGRDYQIGHSYFINVKDVTELHFAWYRRVIPLLQEYFYNDAERLRAVLGSSFIQTVEFDDYTKTVLRNLCDLDNQYRIKVFEPNQEFLQAL